MRITRRKQFKKIMNFYSVGFGFREPFKVLVDGTFMMAALRQKIHLSEKLPLLLGGQCSIMVTPCIVDELRQLPMEKIAGAVAAMKRFRRFKCGHDQDSATSRLAVESREGEDEIQDGPEQEDQNGGARGDEEEEEKIQKKSPSAVAASPSSFDSEDDTRARPDKDIPSHSSSENDAEGHRAGDTKVLEKFCFHPGIQAFREHQQYEAGEGVKPSRSGRNNTFLHSSMRSPFKGHNGSKPSVADTSSSSLQRERGKKRESRRSDGHVSSSSSSSEAPVLVAAKGPDACRCICRVIGHKNLSKFCVATQDSTLREKLRQIPGVPLIFIYKGGILQLEPPTHFSKDCHQKQEIKKLKMGKAERRLFHETRRRVKRENGGGVLVRPGLGGLKREEKSKKKNKRKGVNPLSCKKPKKSELAGTVKSPHGATGKKRTRSRRGTKVSGGEQRND
ncbi:u3 related [Cystoisospora suis]|uniref:U3 related n=1 Tax=Cystoisospora suis TaxID=483139 RepID=A0A2C6L261_9APIC|nr:u3 related [Cystoisospora suis]